MRVTARRRQQLRNPAVTAITTVTRTSCGGSVTGAVRTALVTAGHVPRFWHRFASSDLEDGASDHVTFTCQ